MGDGTEPIADDELLYRRIPESLNWYDPELNAPPSPHAFRPNSQHDLTGLSMWRAKYTTPEECARNDRSRRYYIAVLRTGDLRKHNIEVVARLSEDRPGHVELPSLRSDNRKQTEDIQLRLAELCLEVMGPFP